MSIIERRVLIRFISTTIKIWVLLSWLALVVGAPASLGKHGKWLDWDRALITFSRLLDSVEWAFAVAAPVGMIMVLMELKRTQIFTVLFSAGFSIERLRRIFAFAVLFTMFISLATFETAAKVRSILPLNNTVMHYKSNGVHVWCLDCDQNGHGSKNIILFKDDTLEVSRAVVDSWSNSGDVLIFSGTKALAGTTISTVGVFADTPQSSPLYPSSIRKWFSGSTAIYEVLATINRIFLGSMLLLICAYLALLLPVSYQWIIYIIFLLLTPAVTIGVLIGPILIWTGDNVGYLVEGCWVGGLVSGIIISDFALRVRGLRSA